MFRFIILLIKLFLFPLAMARQEILAELVILRKENQLLKRKLDYGKKRIHFSQWDKFYYSVLTRLFGKLKSIMILVKPETVLKWYKNFQKKRWSFPAKKK